MIFLGIDPGASGGLVAITKGYNSSNIYLASKMPKTEEGIVTWLIALKRMADESVYEIRAVVEKVGGFHRNNPTPGSHMFNFGRNVGVLVGCLLALKIPFKEVIPFTWQKALGIAKREKDETKTSFKNRIKMAAQEFCPGTKVTLSTADALSIAVYCQRLYSGGWYEN